MIVLYKNRPNTGIVCNGDRCIGKVTTQKRQRGERYYTATLLTPERFPIFTASLGTRYPSARAAATALGHFDRDYNQITRSNDREAISDAVTDFRLRWGVVPGKKFVLRLNPTRY